MFGVATKKDLAALSEEKNNALLDLNKKIDDLRREANSNMEFNYKRINGNEREVKQMMAFLKDAEERLKKLEEYTVALAMSVVVDGALSSKDKAGKDSEPFVVVNEVKPKTKGK
jgi:thymidine phosphorylase